MAEIFIFASVFAAAYYGVRLFVVWSRRRKILDVPNERSSHTRPTPRGGGLVIVFIALGFYFFYTVFSARDFVWQYFAGALLIAAVSWLDDLRSVSFIWRILVHAAAALLVIESLIESSAANRFSNETDLIKIICFAAVFLWIVWMTNAYNFMDGIDGIAGAQAVCAGVGWLLIGKILHLETVAVFGGAMAAASLGFLILNWQPAKVFMGDVGSAFLGFSFAVLPVLAWRERPDEFINCFIIGAALVWLFFFDTFVTLAGRIRRRERFWLAHRAHIYQQLVANGFSHSRVAALYGAVSMLNVGLCVAATLDGRLIFLLISAAFAEAVALLLFLSRAKKGAAATENFNR